LQIGSTLERIERFEAEENRVKLLTNLYIFAQKLQQSNTESEFITCVRDEVGSVFPFDYINIDEPKIAELQSFFRLAGTYGSNQKLVLYRKRPFNQVEAEVFKILLEYIDVNAKQLQVFEKEKELAKAKERSSFAQDLHDSVSQLLFSVVLTSKASISQTEDPQLKEQISYSHSISSQALKEMRTIIGNHKPEGVEKGLIPGLTEYAKALGLEIKTNSSGTKTIPYAVEETLWRIGQESLHNIQKHAGTARVNLSLQKSRKSVILEIKDEGKGFDLKKCKSMPSLGLRGMKERADLLGGELEIQSKPGDGTILIVTIPLEGEINEHPRFDCR
jgi:signal transduction histidine kinase